MFEQTLIDGVQQTKKPYTVVLSLLFQIGAIGLLILAPLLYTQTLPTAELKSMLMAPPPPAPPRPPVLVKVRPTASVTRKFAMSTLVAPRIIPKEIPTINDVPAGPNIGTDMSVGAGNGDSLLFSSVGPDTGTVPPPTPLAKPIPKPSAVRVGGAVAEANLTRKVQPVYPALAKSARVQGAVEFSAVISKDGRIENLQLVRGHPLLVNAAREAILQWQYRPTMLNGQAVEVLTTITVNFTLSS